MFHWARKKKEAHDVAMFCTHAGSKRKSKYPTYNIHLCAPWGLSLTVVCAWRIRQKWGGGAPGGRHSPGPAPEAPPPPPSRGWCEPLSNMKPLGGGSRHHLTRTRTSAGVRVPEATPVASARTPGHMTLGGGGGGRFGTRPWWLAWGGGGLQPPPFGGGGGAAGGAHVESAPSAWLGLRGTSPSIFP